MSGTAPAIDKHASNAAGPETRTTATPALPWAVASAKIVSIATGPLTRGSGVHGIKELSVVLGLLQLRNQEFDGIRGTHRIQDAAQNKGFLKIDLVDQKILFPGTRLENVDRREDALVSDFAIKHDFRVTRTFEFFEDNLVHPAAGI